MPTSMSLRLLTSSGAGLSRRLRHRGHHVVEVNRPDPQMRHRRGKSDAVDAEAATRAVQAGTAAAIPKTADGAVEMIRALRVARRSATKARTQALNQLKTLIVTAPDLPREQIRGLHRAQPIHVVTRWRPEAETQCVATPASTPACSAASTGGAPRRPMRR
jgi:hypothetical protein